MKRKSLKTLFSAMLLGSAVFTSQAQLRIFHENFDPLSSAGVVQTDNDFGGDTTSFSGAVVPGAGPGGTPALQEVLNAASGSAGYSFANVQYGNGSLSGNTISSLSDYTLSFIAKANAGSLRLNLQSWSGNGYANYQGQMSTAPDNPGYGNDLTLSPTYTQYTLNLGNSSIFQSQTDGFQPNGGTILITFQLDGSGPTPYTNTLDIDDLELTMTTNFIFETDFDGDSGEGNFNNDYGYCVAGSSTGTTLAGFTGGILDGTGVDGTYANSITANYTLLPTDPAWTNSANTYNYAILGNGTQFGAPINSITPTANLGSLTLSADLQVTGLLPQLTNADVTITKVQFMNGNGNILFDFGGDAGFVGSNYVHIAVPLSSLSYGGGYPYNPPDAIDPITDFTNAAVVGSIASFTVEFAVEGLPVGTVGVSKGPNVISPPFGFTDQGTLNVDNIQLVQTANPIPPTPTQEQLIWQANFDTTFPNSGGIGFQFRDGTDNATGILSTNIGGGFGGSDSLEYTVNLSSWSSSPPAVYSGFGVGGQESPLPDQLSATNKASYRFYFDAKVGNLAANASTNVSAVADLLFYVPPGTESPANASEAVVFDLNPSLTLTTNWQSFVFDGSSCPVGVNNGGSQALFNQYISAVNQMQVQVSTEGSPDIGAQFGYGTNARIDIDNIKVAQLVPATPPVSVVNANGQIEIFWADPSTGGTAQLQSATNVAGPYLDVPGAASGAASPFTVPAGGTQQFFRTVWVP
jgi:hypothetical protein